MPTQPTGRECIEQDVRVPLAKIFGLLVLSRVGICLVGIGSLLVVAKGPYYTPPVSALDCFFRWDAPWHLSVAQSGYHDATASGASNAVFLPLYGWLLRITSLGVFDLKITGYLVSNACLFGACVWLWRTAARETGDPHIATHSVVFLLAAPVSFFFSTLYSESLFFLLTIGSIDSARRDRWFLAGLLGALAALTRLVGVALVVPLVWQYFDTLHRRGSGLKAVRPGALFCCLLPFAGTLVFAAVLNVRFGDPLYYFVAQSTWGRTFSYFWDLFTTRDFRVSLSPFYQVWFAGTVLIAWLLLLGGALLRLPVSYTLLGLSLSLVYVSAKLVESLPRYFSVVFPFYIVLGLVADRWPRSRVPLLAGSIGLQMFSVVLFVNGYWFT